jgi:hypothetical protein
VGIETGYNWARGSIVGVKIHTRKYAWYLSIWSAPIEDEQYWRQVKRENLERQ